MSAALSTPHRSVDVVARLRAAEGQLREANDRLGSSTAEARQLLCDLRDGGQLPAITEEQLDDAVETVFALSAAGGIRGIARIRARLLLHDFLLGQLLLPRANQALQTAMHAVSKLP
jgi:hypothetical protein